ncbi:hypothetical protein BAURA86_03849 [Brevibacterium aurantiacum]|uniref:Transposase DDE domain-containing protein n=1 Tax=Brevibacterium aurantiacum TaxID=273384 RepID=A0A2H1KYY7_BREAU|nr:hypothetical protein BAURA86_03849 [Brevibacterium aurantiacum]
MKPTRTYPRLHVDTAPSNALGQAGGMLLTETVHTSGLGHYLKHGLAAWKKPFAIHDPGKILTDIAITVALGGDALSDSSALRDEPDLYGPVASNPTITRLIRALAADADQALTAINTARAAARARVWELSGAQAPSYDSDARTPLIVDIDATLVTAHSEKEDAKPTYKKGFGFHPLLAFIDHGRPGCGEPAAGLLRPGNAGSNTATDHIRLVKDILAGLPSG